ncbi:MAG: HaeII family restriction endonuclease [Candidatus Margulisiibacteriota bacterium]|nr:HaeII family restriction endonuclease [Candidatus Margulisiibacteriota bacterium]
MASLKEAKKRLDLIIKKARIHLYKPIQIAEILYQHRKKPSFNLSDLESYRRQSKQWRDEVTQKLVGRVSTSSARFQDNLFEANAMPPRFFAVLGKANEEASGGKVEAYIYEKLTRRFETLNSIVSYVFHAKPSTFNLSELIKKFTSEPGLKRSIDKCYEIIAYALFNALIVFLEAMATLEIPTKNRKLLSEFEDFAKTVLNLSVDQPSISVPACVYRTGVTNAADRGLDIWSNFGPAIQIKHVTLDEESATGIACQVAENAKIIVVCKKTDRKTIHSLLSQLGLSKKIQGVVTQNDLEDWYNKCLKGKYADTIGREVLQILKAEFILEFPSTGNALTALIKERKYDKIKLQVPWRV